MRSGDRSVVRLVFGSVALALCLSALINHRGLAQGTTSTISGRVVDGKSGLPAPDATVFASTQEGTLSQRTGPTGEFAFTFAKAVHVRLWVDKPGYLRGYVGQLGSTDSNVQNQNTTINMPLGARIQGVLVKLWSSAAIGGTIRSGTEPVVGATVRVPEARLPRCRVHVVSGSLEIDTVR